MHQPRHRTRRAGIVVALLGLGVASCGDDDSEISVVVEGVELVDAGDSDGQVRLPGTAEVGQRASGSVEIATTVALDGGGVEEDVAVGIQLAYESAVVEADESGTYVSEMTILDATLDAPPELDADAVDVASLIGVTMRQEFAADGTGGDLELANGAEATDAQRQAFESFAGDLTTTTIVYPAEPVGEGATWRATLEIERKGFELPVTYEYTLTSLAGGDYAIDVRYDQDVDTDVDVDGRTAAVSGTIAGGGTMTGSTSNPLVATSDLSQDLDLTLTAEGESIDMVMRVDVTMGVDDA